MEEVLLKAEAFDLKSMGFYLLKNSELERKEYFCI